jgi:hypothetical protein
VCPDLGEHLGGNDNRNGHVRRNNKCACNRIRNIIVRAWRMIDAVAAAPSRPALKSTELRCQPRQI